MESNTKVDELVKKRNNNDDDKEFPIKAFERKFYPLTKGILYFVSFLFLMEQV
jgi:hypothetical protein